VFLNQEEDMNRVGIVGIVSLIVALAACNPTPNQDPGTPDPSEGQPPLVTPVGTNVGNPVTQTIGATGGTVTAGGVTVSAPAGAFSSANLSVQPITGTLNGAGQGVAISSDAAWGKYLTVTFPIEATDENPDGLGLAIQQKDGSWLSLEPVKVDKVAGTVSAGLLAPTNGAGLRTQDVTILYRLEKYQRFFIKPSSARVRVKEKQLFTPWSQAGTERCPYVPAKPGEDDLVPLGMSCLPVVNKEPVPFWNQKDGFTRQWLVNGIPNGDATVGTISVSTTGKIGATYTAPANKPSPDKVTVTFESTNIKTGWNLRQGGFPPTAEVTILDNIRTYTGTISVDGYDAAKNQFKANGNLTFKSDATGNSGLVTYKATGSLTVTDTYTNCLQFTTSLQVEGDLVLIDKPGEKPKFSLSVLPGESKVFVASCNQASVEVPVLLVFTTNCDGTLLTEDLADFNHIKGSKTVECKDEAGNVTSASTAEWDLTAQTQ
jgi:hypothetical protein